SATQADDGPVADDVVRAVQAEDRRHFLPVLEHVLGDEQVRRHAAARLRGVGNEPPHELPAILLVLRLHVEGTPFPVAGELPHHGFHAADDFGPALRPVLGCLHGDGVAVRPTVDEELVARQPALRVRGCRNPEAHAAETNEESKGSENRYGFTHWTVLCTTVPGPKKSG